MVGEHVWERPRVCEPTENQNPTVLSRREPSFLNTHSTLIKRGRGGGEGRDRAGEGEKEALTTKTGRSGRKGGRGGG